MILSDLAGKINVRYHQDYVDPVWCDPITPSDFADRSKKNLLVSVGESWTNYTAWVGKPIVAERYWGLNLAQKLDCDWLNIAASGFSNNWMIDNLIHFAENFNSLDHDRKIIVVCLTEIGRELSDSKVFNYNFRSELAPLINGGKDLNQVINFQIDKFIGKIHHMLSLFDQKTEIILGSNFSDVLRRIGADENIRDRCLPMSWIEILAGKYDMEFPPMLPFIWEATIEKYINFLNDRSLFSIPDSAIKNWIIDHADRSSSLIEWLRKCPGIGGESDRHPNNQGREAWTNYLVDYLSR